MQQEEPNNKKPKKEGEDEKKGKTSNEFVRKLAEEKYKYGFTTDVHTDIIPTGLNEDIVRLISAKKEEPEWLLEFRLKAYRHWLTLEPPTWAHLTIPPIDFQDIIYYAAPKPKKQLGSMDEVDPELKRTFDKLGIPLECWPGASKAAMALTTSPNWRAGTAFFSPVSTARRITPIWGRVWRRSPP